MRWALGVRDAAKISCYEANRFRHRQHNGGESKGFVFLSLSLSRNIICHVSSKERMRFLQSLQWKESSERARSGT